MLEKGSISQYQLWLLMINFCTGSTLLLIPSIVVGKSKQDAWISMLLGTFIAIGIINIYIKIAEQFPYKNLVEVLQTTFGFWIGKGIALLYAWFFLFLSSLVIRDSLDFITIALMPETPVFTFAIMAFILILLVSIQGIEGIARSTEFFAPIATVGFWLTLLLTIPEMNVTNIFPIFAEGVKPVFSGIVPILSFPFAELVVFLMILPYLNQRKHLKTTMRLGIIFGGSILFFNVLGTILVLNIRPTQLSIYAPFNVARIINIGNFLVRIETLFAVSFVLTIFIKMILTFYAGVLALAQIFGLQNYRSIIVPTLFFVVTLSIVSFKNIVVVLEFTAKVSTPYTLLFGIMIPLLLLGTHYLKQKWKRL